MPKSDISVRHSLPQHEALERIKNLLPSVKDRYSGQISDLKEEWTNNGGIFSLKAMGFSVKGSLVVTSSDAQISLEFPWAAIPFKRKIESSIREEALNVLKS